MRGRFAKIQLVMARRNAPYPGPFTGVHTTGGSPSTDAVTSTIVSQPLYFIPQAQETIARSFPEAQQWNAPWLLKARIGVTVSQGDVFTNGVVAFRITEQPVTHYGFVLAPAQLTAVPAASTAGNTNAGMWMGIGRIPTYAQDA